MFFCLSERFGGLDNYERFQKQIEDVNYLYDQFSQPIKTKDRS